MEVECRGVLEVRLVLTIDEAEARALDALAGYGADEFIAAFYDKLGAAYMQDHEAGLRSFLSSVRSTMPYILQRLELARKAWNGV